jgi:hypothetical protein
LYNCDLDLFDNIVILISVLLQTNAQLTVYGLDRDAISKLLVVSNALVVVMPVVAYAISAKLDSFAGSDNQHSSSAHEPLLHPTPGIAADGERELFLVAEHSASSDGD